MLNKICTYLASLGPIGTMPAGGTIASLVTVIFAWFITPYVTTWYYFLPFLAGASLLIIDQSLKHYDEPDPSTIVLDEVIGMLCALCALPHFLLVSTIAFFFFRILDILKPWPLRTAERLPGACGVLSDDILAGISACGITHLLLWAFSTMGCS